MIEQLKQLIEQAPVITIFRHNNADGDALGSQWGLKTWITQNYPDKKVYALGDHTASIKALFPQPDVLDDDTIKQSLAIVVDTANRDRINDQRALTARFIYKIDHHINVDQYGHAEFVNSQAASTCEILTEIFRGWTDGLLSKEVAHYLFIGMLTDTISFSTTNTTANTFASAYYLAQTGIDISLIQRNIKTKPKTMFIFESFVRSKIVFEDNLAYVIITQQDYQQHQVTANQAKTCVNVMNNIEGINVWALFIEDENKPEVFNGSLRSFKITINEAAAKFNGGGHKNAAGVNNLTFDQISEVIATLKSLERDS